MLLAYLERFTTSNNHYFNPPNIYVDQASNVLLSQNDEIKIYGSFFLAPLSATGTIPNVGELFKGVTTGNYYTGTATIKLISGNI